MLVHTLIYQIDTHLLPGCFDQNQLGDFTLETDVLKIQYFFPYKLSSSIFLILILRVSRLVSYYPWVKGSALFWLCQRLLRPPRENWALSTGPKC